MKAVVFFPGRFQPYALHHHKSYIFLCSMFGSENVYITTSDITSVESPLNFNERKMFIRKLDPNANIIKCKNVYAPEEVLMNFDPNQTISISCYSIKDSGRIKYSKVDGSTGYFQPFINLHACQPFSKHSYIFLIPEFKIKFKGKNISGTLIRNWVKELDVSKDNKRDCKSIFGYYDIKLIQLLINKIKK